MKRIVLLALVVSVQASLVDRTDCDFDLERVAQRRQSIRYRTKFRDGSVAPIDCRLLETERADRTSSRVRIVAKRSSQLEIQIAFSHRARADPAFWLNCTTNVGVVALKACTDATRRVRRTISIANPPPLDDLRSTAATATGFACVGVVAGIVLLSYVLVLCVGKEKKKGGDDAESGGNDKEDEKGDCLKASESKASKPVEVIGNGEKKAEEAKEKEEEEEENKKDGETDKENEAARPTSTATTKSDEPTLPDRRPLSPDNAVRGSPLAGHKDARGRGGGGGDSPRLPPQRLFSRSKASPHTPTKEAGPPLPESNAKRPLPREREATPPAAAAVEDDEDEGDTLYAKVTDQHQHRPRAGTLDDVTYAEPEVPSTRKAFTLPAKGRSAGGGVSFDLSAYESDPDADADSMYATPTLEPKKQEEEKEKTEEDASDGAVVYAQPSRRRRTSPAPPADVDELYAKVDKEKKTSSSPKSDLYAQPHKHGKGVQLDHHATASLGEDGYSHVKVKPKEAHGYSKVGPPAAAVKVQHDELGYAVVDKKIGSEDDPDYEKVAFGEGSGSAKKADVPDPGYEKVGPDSGIMEGDDPDYEKVNIAENVKKKNGDIPDPGYEKVGPNSDVMARGKEAKEPDYEKVGPDSILMKGKSDEDVPDPGYEKLGNGSGGGSGNDNTNASSPVDPNYEDVGEVRQRAVSLDREDDGDGDGDDAVPPAPAGKREAASLPLSPVDPNYDEIDDDFRKRIEEFQQKDTDDKEAERE